MNTSSPPTTQALLAQADWIRRLVAGLVYDPSRTDDILQETLLAAIERPPREVSDLRSWLATVAKNLVRNDGRAEGRRARREALSAKIEAQPDTVDVIGRARMQGRLAEAVVALDEPSRTPVLMRYFEDLPPREIAKRLDRPVNTVHSQIRRGLAILRSELDSEYGDREAWGLAVLPLFAPAGNGAAAKVAAVSTFAKGGLAVALAFVVLAGWIVADMDFGTDEPLVDVVSADRVAASEAADGQVVRPAAAADTRLALKEEPGQALCTVTFVDPESGAPVDGVPWWVIRTGNFDIGSSEKEDWAPKALHGGTTAQDGQASFPVPSDQIVHVVTGRTSDFARGSFPLVIEGESAGRDWRLVLGKGGTLEGRVVDRSGLPRGGLSLSRRTLFHTEEALGVTADDGTFRVDRMADLPRRFLRDAAGSIRAARVDPEHIRFDPGDNVPDGAGWYTCEEKVSVAGRPRVDVGDVVVPLKTTVKGRVIDSGNRPISGALVSSREIRSPILEASARRSSDPQPWGEGRPIPAGDDVTDEDGRFSLDLGILPQSSRRCVLVFTADGRRQIEEITLETERPPPVLITVEEGRGITLRLIDPEAPDGALWHYRSSTPKLSIWGFNSDGLRARQPERVKVHPGGRVQLSEAKLEILGDEWFVMLDGYEPRKVSQGGDRREITVELKKEPAVEVTVQATGPGAGAAVACDLMVSGLPPVEPWETWSLVGPVGSRSLNSGGSGLIGATLGDVRLGEKATLPRPPTKEFWVYVQLTEPAGYAPVQSKAFGPFTGSEGVLECTVESEAWVLPRSSADEGDAAGFIDRRDCDVHLRVVSEATGEPLEEVDFLVPMNGKHRSVGESSETGRLKGFLRMGATDVRLRHPRFAERRLDSLEFVPGGSIELGDVELTPLNLLYGQLVDDAGQPVHRDTWLRWDDEQGVDRWLRCEDDGSFVLGYASVPIREVRVMGEETPMQVGVMTELRPTKLDAAPDGHPSVECTVPQEVEVEIVIEGIPMRAALTNQPIHLDTSYGVRKRLWPAPPGLGFARFTLTLLPGTYTLSRGVAIDFPAMPLVITGDEDSSQLTVRIAGSVGFE